MKNWKVYAKGIVGGIGLALTTAQGLVNGDSPAGRWITAGLAFVTFLGVVLTPNAKPVDPQAAYLGAKR